MSDGPAVIKRGSICDTPYLEMVQVDYLNHEGVERSWYGVSRKNQTAAVQVAAVTKDRQLLLVKQYRPLVDRFTYELPAGLMDVPGETVIEVAQRELLEETGYAGINPYHVLGGDKGLTVSVGLTDERIHLVLMREVEKVADPYTNEGTEPFLVPLDNAVRFLGMQRYTDINVSYGIFGTLYLIQTLV